MQLATRAHNWYKNAPWALAALALLLATYSAAIPIAVLAHFFPSWETGPGSQTMDTAGIAGKFFLASVLAPLVETAMLQWAPIRMLRGTFGAGPRLTVCVSAALFAATHAYSLGYVCLTFLIGLVLAYGYLVRSLSGGHAFWVVFSAHALRNLVATVARLF